MSIKNCINKAVSEGRMDPGRAAEAQAKFDAIEAEYLDALGPEGARIRANDETVRRLRIEAAIKRRQVLMQAAVQARIIHDMETVVRRSGLKDRSELALARIDSAGMRNLPFRGAQQEYKAVLGRAHQLFADGIEHHGRKITGVVRNKATLLNVLRELFGENSGNANAKVIARAWSDTSEFLRNQFNAVGGAIGKLERWGIPQHHDTVKVRRAGYDAWRDVIFPKLDRQRMIDGATGLPFSDAKLELVLRDVFETIRTDGFSKVTPSGGGGGRSVAERRNDHRFLHFKTADDWLAYQKKFGHDDPADIWDAMLGHMSGMSRDIGAMRALGPNPRATVRFLQDTLRKDAALLTGEGFKANLRRNRIDKHATHLEALYETFTGEVNAPVNGIAARTFGTVRHGLVAAQLGSATLSAISDVAFQRMAAAHAGLNQARLMFRIVKLLNPLDGTDRAIALRTGLIAEELTQMAAAQGRYTAEILSNGLAARISDGVLRASGLSAWTQAGRWAFGMEFMATLAEHAGIRFDKLPKPLRNTLDNYGIGADAWDLVRRSAIYEAKPGLLLLRPSDVASATHIMPADQADDLATKLLTMIQTETEFAVPSTSLRGRAALVGKSAKPGTIAGEILLSGLMYKSFSVSVAFTHIRRIGQQQGHFNKARYAAALVVSTTLMGALSIWSKEIAFGRDPSDAFSKEHAAAFWMRALLQGGGVGIFGDFVLTDYSRFGQSLATTVAGPLIGYGTATARLAIKTAQGEGAAEVMRYLGNYLPGGSIWYARLGFQRLVLDQIQRQIDPGARKRWRRQEKKLRKEKGSSFWWPRGSLSPARPPAIGGSR